MLPQFKCEILNQNDLRSISWKRRTKYRAKSFAVEEVDCNCPEGQCDCHLHHH